MLLAYLHCAAGADRPHCSGWFRTQAKHVVKTFPTIANAIPTTKRKPKWKNPNHIYQIYLTPTKHRKFQPFVKHLATENIWCFQRFLQASAGTGGLRCPSISITIRRCPSRNLHSMAENLLPKATASYAVQMITPEHLPVRADWL